MSRSGILIVIASLVVAACLRPVTEAPPVEAPDAGGDAGIDAGLDAGFDPWPSPPVRTSCEGVVLAVSDAGPCLCDGGTVACLTRTCFEAVCQPCGAEHACPPDYTCEDLRPPSCEGTCRRRFAPCEPDLSLEHLSITLGGGWDSFEWMHDVDLTQRWVSCSVRNAWRGGPAVALGAGDAGALNWSGLRLASCLREEDFGVTSCRTDVGGVLVRSADGGFWFDTGGSTHPAPEFEAAVIDVARACAPLFRAWDGGTYPWRF